MHPKLFLSLPDLWIVNALSFIYRNLNDLLVNVSKFLLINFYNI